MTINNAAMSSCAQCRLRFHINKVNCVTCRLPTRVHYKPPPLHPISINVLALRCMTGSYLGVHRTVVTFVILIRFLSLLPTEVAVNNEDDLY